MRRHAFERGLCAFACRHNLLPGGARVLAAVSGGPDSMAMLHALACLSRGRPGFHLVVAHLDHGLRGRKGAADARFVAGAARRLRLPVVIGRVPVLRASGESLETAARRVRYAFLEQAALDRRCDRVAVAHTADDQAETVLHRLCRGAGLRGLAAMRPSRALAAGESLRLIRPLLALTRQDVIDYLRALRVRYRIDETNRWARWTRNRIRLRVLPMLSREVHEGAPRALARFASQAAAAHDLIRTLALNAEGSATPTTRGWTIDRSALAALPPAVRGELWMRLLEQTGRGTPEFAEVDAADAVAEGARPSASLWGGAVVIRGGRRRVRVEIP
jgi:tRNA(Ile)-lysidine synthase